MLKKRNAMQLASLLMCAALMNASFPMAYAAEDSGSVQAATENMETDGGEIEVVQTETEEATEVSLPEIDGNISDSEGDNPEEDSKIENAISIFFDGAMVPVVLEKEASIKDFAAKLAELADVSINDAVCMDLVDDMGVRTRIQTESGVNTVMDLYDMTKEQGSMGLVLFNDTQEVLRVDIRTTQDADILDVRKDEAVPYKVTFNANGGTLDEEVVLFRAEGETISYIEASATYDENHTFEGWYDAAEGGNEVTSDTKVTSDMEVFAHWKTANYTLTFDSCGGSAVEAMTGSVENAITELPAPTRDGYVFNGWYDAVEGGNQVTSVSLDKDVTLYAHWEAVRYTLTFDSCGGSAVAMTGSVENTITDFPTPTREGFVFKGWYDAAEGGNQVTSITLDSDMILYAHWEAAGYVLTFDSQGGSVVNSMSGSVENPVTDFPTPTREGYTFKGWYDAAGGGNQVTSVTLNGDMTLYARWEAVSYTLTFDSQGGNAVKAMNGTVEKPVSNFPTPTKEGFTFEGWYDAAEGGKNVTSVTLNKDMTLYAHWKAATYVITLNDGMGNTTTVKVNVGTRFTDFPTPEYEGYTFKGWFTGKEASASRVTEYSGDKDVTFYAQWEKQETANTPAPTPTSTPNDTPTENQQSAENVAYSLTVSYPDGSVKNVSVKGTHTLKELSVALGYNEVSSWGVKQANVTEHNIDGDVTIAQLAEMLKDGDLAVIAYDSTGAAMGCAVVKQSSEENKFDVMLSKDTNVSLRSASEINGTDDGNADGKGKGEGETNPVAQEGKSDSFAESVKTGDTDILPLYIAMGMALVALLGILGVKKKGYKSLFKK